LCGVGLVKRLCTYFEAQAFHLFDNMVAPSVNVDILVEYGIVLFLVDNIQQRGNRWKFRLEEIHRRFDSSLIDVSENDDDHQFTRRCRTDNKVPQGSFVLPKVVKRDAIFQSERSQSVANGIGVILLQIAVLDIEDFVESGGHMEP